MTLTLISALVIFRYKLGLHYSNRLFAPCAQAVMHMRLFVNFTQEEIEAMVSASIDGTGSQIYTDSVTVE